MNKMSLLIQEALGHHLRLATPAMNHILALGEEGGAPAHLAFCFPPFCSLWPCHPQTMYTLKAWPTMIIGHL